MPSAFQLRPCPIPTTLRQKKAIGHNTMGHSGTFRDVKMAKISRSFRTIASISPFFHNVPAPPTPPPGTFGDILGHRPVLHPRRGDQAGVNAPVLGHTPAGGRPFLQAAGFSRFPPRPALALSPSTGPGQDTQGPRIIIALHQRGRLPVNLLMSERLRLDNINEAFDRLHQGKSVRQIVTI